MVLVHYLVGFGAPIVFLAIIAVAKSRQDRALRS